MYTKGFLPDAVPLNFSRMALAAQPLLRLSDREVELHVDLHTQSSIILLDLSQ